MDRKVVDAALSYAEETGGPAAALELDNGKMILGKTSDLLGALSAVLLNSLKELAGIDRHYHVISPAAIEPIQLLKTEYLGSYNRDFTRMRCSSPSPPQPLPTKQPSRLWNSSPSSPAVRLTLP